MEVNTDTLITLQLTLFYIDDHDMTISSPCLMIWIGSSSIYSMLIKPILLSILENIKLRFDVDICKASRTKITVHVEVVHATPSDLVRDVGIMSRD